ncbi:MAG: hypothetical protein NVS3B20_25440 [Polyangiales bacterium]
MLAHDPAFVDARYNLLLLTHRGGANAEAHHHLDKLAEVAPNDPRLPALRAQMADR